MSRAWVMPLPQVFPLRVSRNVLVILSSNDPSPPYSPHPLKVLVPLRPRIHPHTSTPCNPSAHSAAGGDCNWLQYEKPGT